MLNTKLMNNLQELADFLSAQRFLGIAHKFYGKSQACLEIFADNRDCLQDIVPLLKGFEITEKIKGYADRSEKVTIAVEKY